MRPELAAAISNNTPLFFYHDIHNYGDFLNVPFFQRVFGRDIHFLDQAALTEVPPEIGVFMGVGTLIGYIFPGHFYKNRKVTFLGTGAVAKVRSTEFFRECGGFTRGLLSQTVTGIKAGGDPFLLVDQVLNFRRRETVEATAVFVNKFARSFHVTLPKPTRYRSAAHDMQSIQWIYEKLATAKYVVTDRLHIAVTAESMHVPWVLWNHGESDLIDHSEKFLDWAQEVKKADFVVAEEQDLSKVIQNTNFEISEGQKPRLLELLRNTIGTAA